jgi:hypothetical protein
MRGDGFLAIWSDVEATRQTDYLHWLGREHTTERLTTEGFIAVRVFRALGIEAFRVFILYDLSGPEMLGGEDYLRKLNAPTPWSQRIMPMLSNFIRGGGRPAGSAGIGQGGLINVMALQETPEDAAKIAADIAALDRIAAVHILKTDLAATAIQTNEKAMRGQDRSFEALLVMEGFDEDALLSAFARLPQVAPELKTDQAIPALLYRQIFALDRDLIGTST